MNKKWNLSFIHQFDKPNDLNKNLLIDGHHEYPFYSSFYSILLEKWPFHSSFNHNRDYSKKHTEKQQFPRLFHFTIFNDYR